MRKLTGTRTRGLTLIELVVVLLVLIALAGILIPQLSGFVNRSHTAAASTNLGEIQKAFTLYEAKFLNGYPSGYDLPLLRTGSIPPYLQGDALTAITPGDLTGVQSASLRDGGIKVANYMRPESDFTTSGLSRTFDVTDQTIASAGDPLAVPPVPPTLAGAVLYDGTASSKTIAVLDPAIARRELGLADAGEIYVAFGIGRNCTAIGKVMADAPVHFDQVDPKEVYSRYFAVYAIPTSSNVVGFRARFVGALGAELTGLSGHIGDYYSKDSQ